MDLIPDVSARHAHRTPDVTWTEQQGRVVLVRRKFGAFGTKVLALAKMSPDLTVRLDALGSAVWLLCDGRTVAELKVDLVRQFPGETDLNRRLGSFLGTMVSKGLVRLD